MWPSKDVLLIQVQNNFSTTGFGAFEFPVSHWLCQEDNKTLQSIFYVKYHIPT